ncbi:uncharacterized protein LOC127383689 [Apus apus]|uniref:uncharacterized protein LOC127383689 n=1 Tax=Apus apus TaxID=8895 RepID=UPI0021F8C01E|nr:uncharacterized protein LOC127383689 [Apus apus]
MNMSPEVKAGYQTIEKHLRLEEVEAASPGSGQGQSPPSCAPSPILPGQTRAEDTSKEAFCGDKPRCISNAVSRRLHLQNRTPAGRHRPPPGRARVPAGTRQRPPSPSPRPPPGRCRGLGERPGPRPPQRPAAPQRGPRTPRGRRREAGLTLTGSRAQDPAQLSAVCTKGGPKQPQGCNWCSLAVSFGETWAKHVACVELMEFHVDTTTIIQLVTGRGAELAMRMALASAAAQWLSGEMGKTQQGWGSGKMRWCQKASLPKTDNCQQQLSMNWPNFLPQLARSPAPSVLRREPQHSSWSARDREHWEISE